MVPMDDNEIEVSCTADSVEHLASWTTDTSAEGLKCSQDHEWCQELTSRQDHSTCSLVPTSEPRGSDLSTGTLPSSECPGIPLNWPVDRFFETYPFQRHEFQVQRGLGYRFCRVDNNGRQFWVRSDSCMHVQTSPGRACPSCEAVREKVAHLAALSRDAPPHTNHTYLNNRQLRTRLQEQADALQKWKLKVRSMHLHKYCVLT